MACLIKRGIIYYVCYNVNGREKRVSTKTANRAEAKKILDEYRKREINAAHGIRETEPLTVGDYWPKYRSICANENSPGWAKIKGIIFKAHLIPFFGEYRLDRIGRQMIDNYRSKRLRCGVKAKTINNEIVCLTAMLHRAADSGIIPPESIPRIKRLKVARGRVRFLSREEVERFLDSARIAGYDVEAFCRLMLFAGLRRGEALNLRWMDVDLDTRKIFIFAREGWRPKSGNRTIPMANELRDYLSERRSLFPEDTMIVGRSTHWQLERSIRRVVAGAGLEIAGENRVTAHTLRHTYASHLVMAGAPLYTVAALLGHRDAATTQIYAHLAPDHLREVAGELSFN